MEMPTSGLQRVSLFLLQMHSGSCLLQESVRDRGFRAHIHLYVYVRATGGLLFDFGLNQKALTDNNQLPPWLQV